MLNPDIGKSSKSTVAARNREESTELAFVRQSDLSPVHLDDEYARQIGSFSTIRERVFKIEDCPLERDEFELLGDFVNQSVSHLKASSSSNKLNGAWVHRDDCGREGAVVNFHQR
jgi:Asp-tRNA(Asn)/Glu-tRNA(Gln) amidotransferase B subunit